MDLSKYLLNESDQSVPLRALESREKTQFIMVERNGVIEVYGRQRIDILQGIFVPSEM